MHIYIYTHTDVAYFDSTSSSIKNCNFIHVFRFLVLTELGMENLMIESVGFGFKAIEKKLQINTVNKKRKHDTAKLAS